ncbi:MAG: DUF1992 domain-containing protein [Paracoccaceae bacterium]|nr:DUF1992 domain-containing protein [Paracoccaceae bacterium]
MAWYSRLIERQIQKAKARGELENLEGEGAPLPDRTGDAFVDPGIAAEFRAMPEAGVLPEEIVLKKQADELKARLAKTRNPDKRRALMSKLTDVQMRQAIAEEARKRFFGM